MFKILSLIGFPIFFLGSTIPYLNGTISYFIGCTMALSGTFIISRAMVNGLNGIGFALIGFPIFFLSMSPTSYDWLSEFIDKPAIFLVRLSACLVGGLLALQSFNENEV